MYELIILGFLMRSISHGYRISKIINDMIGPYAKVSSGRLYPLFDKMTRDSFIIAVDEEGGSSRHRQYEITEKGKLRFHQLMLDTTSNLGEYRKLFGFKFVFIDLLDLKEKLYLLDHYITHCQTHLFYLHGEMEDLKRRESEIGLSVKTPLCVMEHNQSQWQLELDWAKRIREEFKSKEENA